MKYIFGAAFDPITLGHIAIIKSVHKHLTKDDQMFVLVSNNDEKKYHTSLDERFDVVSATLKSVFKTNCPAIIEQDRRTYMFLNEHFAGQADEITIIMGEDEWNALLDDKWMYSEKLLNKYKFMVARRNGEGELRDHDLYNVKEVTMYDDCNAISSSHVREVFYRNPATVYSDVKDNILKKTFELIKENHLYKQNGEDYAQEEAAYLEKYAIMKKENGWGDPSVTADIVAYNGNKVLLIRRGGFPYKNYWAVPGGFFNAVDTVDKKTGEVIPRDPDIDYAAAREFEEETTIRIDHSKFKQIKTYAHMFDPRCRIVDVAFAVRVNAKDMKKAVGADDALEAKWFDLDDLPAMAFHHAQIINDWKAQQDRD